MNVSSIVLACTSLGLGTASVYLYTELDAQRARADAETALRRDQEARVHDLEARLNRGFGLMPDTNIAAGSVPDPDGKNHPPPDALSEEPAVAVAEPGRRFGNNMRSAFSAMLSTPEGRERMIARQKMGLRLQYKDLAKELGLSADQSDKLMTLLAEQQMRQMEKLQQGMGDRAAVSQAMNELQRQNETELMTLLGDKYLPFESYQSSLGERQQLEQMGTQFEAASLPLNDSQKKQLLAAMVQESKASPRPTWTDAANQESFMQQQRAWQQTYNQRIKERAAEVLTSQQLKQFEEMQQSQGPMGIALPGMRFNGAAMRGVRPQRQQ